eukprot:5954921-Prymnesium_polylepis.1
MYELRRIVSIVGRLWIRGYLTYGRHEDTRKPTGGGNPANGCDAAWPVRVQRAARTRGGTHRRVPE